VKNAPLLLADRRSVSKHDLIEADQIWPDKVNQTDYIYHRQNHKWYWLSNQTPDEIVLFATWNPNSNERFAGPQHLAY
jgi:hypothetical protein